MAAEFWKSLIFIFVPFIAASTVAHSEIMDKVVNPLAITSPSFLNGRMIPARHTCDGVNISPQLTWTNVPPGTRSLALIVDDPDTPDPDAPQMTWVHWVLYNIPPDAIGLKEGIAERHLPAGTLQGINDWKVTGYGGPCPPFGRHRYFFKVYALNLMLSDLGHPAKAALEAAMRGHIIAQAELMGHYQRNH